LKRLLGGEERPAPTPRVLPTTPEPAPEYKVTFQLTRKDDGFLRGEHYVDVVGESYRQDVIAKLARARKPLVAELIREPDNEHDANAVRVDIHGETVGYVAREDAPSLHPLLERLRREGRPAQVAAHVTGGGEGRHYGVIIDGLPEN
jgi:hypothetical protein